LLLTIRERGDSVCVQPAATTIVVFEPRPICRYAHTLFANSQRVTRAIGYWKHKHTHIAEMPDNKRARTQTRRCKLGMLCGAHVRRVLRRSITGASQLIYYIEPRESEARRAWQGGNINLQQLKLQPWCGQQLTLCTRFCLCVCVCMLISL